MGVAVLACTASSIPSTDTSATEASPDASRGGAFSSSSGDTGGDATEGEPDDRDDGGASGVDASDGSSPAPQLRKAVRLDGSSAVCSIVNTPAGTYFGTKHGEVRRVTDAQTGATTLVATMPAASQACVTLAATPTALYVVVPLVRGSGGHGELRRLPLNGGAGQLVGTIPARTPSQTDDGYPIVSDGTDVFIAADPNVWHLPATAGGSLTRLMIGASNFYAQDLALGPLGLYTWHDGSQRQVSWFSKTGTLLGTKTGVPAGHHTFVFAADALFSSRFTFVQQRTPASFDAAATPFVTTAAAGSALAADASRLYVANGENISVFTLATGAPVETFATKIGLPQQPSIEFSPELLGPLSVDGSHVYARENGGEQMLMAFPK